MYKNLNAESLGISCGQSELIELALTYRFKGLDLDVAGLANRVQTEGERASRFLVSANMKVGGFELPVRWFAAEEDYKADLAKLSGIAEVAASVNARRSYATIMPASDELPYHENFEIHRQRIGEIAEVLAAHEIQLGLGFLAAASHREGREFQFIHLAEELLTLIKTIGSENVGLMLDWWNWQVGGGGLDQIRELTADQLVIVRVADVPDDADLASITDDQRLCAGENESTTVGAPLLALGELGYDGPITPYPHASRFSGVTRDAIIQQVSSLLDKQWKAASLTKSGKVAVTAES